MKQTATDWLIDVLSKNFGIAISDNIIEQAKELEKQQIRDAYFMGWKTREHKPINTEARHEDYSNYYLRDIYGL